MNNFYKIKSTINILTTIFILTVTLNVSGQKRIKEDTLLRKNEHHYDKSVEKTPDSLEIAQPIDGIIKFYKAIGKNVKYPEGLNLKGKVYLELTIDSLGQLKDTKIITGINSRIDNEAIRVITSLNYPFKPAIINGKPAKSKLILPIAFDPNQKSNL